VPKAQLAQEFKAYKVYKEQLAAGLLFKISAMLFRGLH
jgi:hypothetical protein